MYRNKIHSQLRAFTLVELSIVLLIIGLLVGGSAAGSKLIAQARVKKAYQLSNSTAILEIETDDYEKAVVAWYDVFNEESVIRDSSNVVSEWRSKVNTPLLYSLRQSSASLKPVYRKLGASGLPGIYFTGGDKLVAANALLSSDESWAIAVAYVPTITQTVHAGIAAVQNSVVRARYDGLAAFYNGIGEPRVYYYKVGKPNFFLLTVDDSGGASSVVSQHYLNNQGPNGNTGNPQSNIYTELTVGNTNNAYTGEVLEIIIFNKILTDEDVNVIRDYFLTKYSIS